MNKSTILACVSAIGVAVTGITTAKATTKANELLLEARIEKGDELTTKEKIKIAAPVYIPAVLIGVSTIACVLGGAVLSKRQQTALTSAYVLLDTSYKEYRKKVKELYGDDADNKVKEAITKSMYEDANIEEELRDSYRDEPCLFFDYNTMTYFHAYMDDVITRTVMDDGLECYTISLPTEPPLNWLKDIE